MGENLRMCSDSWDVAVVGFSDYFFIGEYWMLENAYKSTCTEWGC